MTTLRDDLEAALSAAETTETTEPVEVSADPPPESSEAPEKAPRTRDESGRFASQAKEQQAEPQEVQPTEQPTTTTRKPPSSWKKDYWGKWEKLASDPELAPLQDYLEQRESEFARGVSTYREEAVKAKALQDAIAPYVPVMQQYGLDPAQHVQNLLGAHHTLSTGTPEQKLQLFQRLATDYGVSLQNLVGQGDQQQSMLLHELQQLKGQFGHLAMTAQQREQAETAAQINAFKENAPHFEEARATMAGLLQSGMAKDLQDAYEKAIRLTPELWDRVQAEKAHAAAQASAKQVADKRQAAVSPRSSAPTGRVAVSGGNDLRSLLGAAFEQHGAGRL
jgi:hypothetical protein